MSKVKIRKYVTCIGCGCDDMHACLDVFGDACHWLRADHLARLGVCSCCPQWVKAWDEGDRDLHAITVPRKARS